MSIFNSDLKIEEITSVLKDVKNSIRFVGILGSGMYPLAALLNGRAYRVSGSDDNARKNFYTDKCGIVITKPLQKLDGGVGLVVYSLAIDEENSEIQYARSHGIPLISRAQLLGALMSMHKTRISVSGSHGKSTVTALLDHILTVSDTRHTTVCGARLSSGEAFTDGGGDVFIAEACEYKDSFLRLCPTHQLITSVELDHTDYFENTDAICASFSNAAKNAQVVLFNYDDFNARSIADKISKENSKAPGTLLTYGRSECADYRLASIVRSDDVTRFSVVSKGKEFALITSLIGRFNLYNITAAVAMADMLGIKKKYIEKAVESFASIERRMTLISSVSGVPVYYDYAHHPSEIRAVISALKEKHGTLTVIFRPHTYSRTQSLWKDFITELGKSDFTILLDIYPAREKPIDGVDSQKLAEAVKNGVYSDMSNAASLAISRPTGAIALLGAGEVDDIKREFIQLGKNSGYIPKRR